MKSIRESASIILTARRVNKCVRAPPPANYNYDLLCLKRKQTTSFMPSTYVFPGGVIEPSDADPKWQNLFSAFGFDKNSFYSLTPDVKTRPLIFKQQPNELPREISLRISAIRETFEECGILLCRKTNEAATHSDWAQHIEMSKDDIYKWQKRVHNDATEFYSLCKNFDCYPDLWSLYEWSNWLTPTSYDTKRFDAVFYLACIQDTPQTVCEVSEIEDLKWDMPANFFLGGFTLPPPQQYEIARVSKFESIYDLLNFAVDRSKRGVQQMFPVKVKLQDGNVFVLRGDSMYPKEASLFEKQIINKSDMTIQQFREVSPITHRTEFYDCGVRKLFIQNFDNEDSHLAPMQLTDVRVIHTKKN